MASEACLTHGKHKGQPINKVPRSYLQRAAAHGHPEKRLIKAELRRRRSGNGGERKTPIPVHLDALQEAQNLVVTGHACERLQERCADLFLSTAQDGERFEAWLKRMAQKALVSGTLTGWEGHYRLLGIDFVVKKNGARPVLKTIMRERGQAQRFEEVKPVPERRPEPRRALVETARPPAPEPKPPSWFWRLLAFVRRLFVRVAR